MVSERVRPRGGPGVTVPGERPPGERPAVRGRLLGLDVVRSIAILSMVFVHAWPTGWLTPMVAPDDPVPVLQFLNELISNRSLSLFVFCAGVSVALMTGGARPPSGRAMTLARRRLAVRSAAMFPLALLGLAIGEAVLLSFCLWFLLLLPVLRLRARPLFAAAAAFCLISPLYRYLQLNFAGEWAAPGDVYAILTNPGDWPAWAGYYLAGPDTPYAIPLLLAGMGLGRLDLGARTVRIRLMFAGTAVMAASGLLSWLAAGPLGGTRALAQVVPAPPGDGRLPWITPLMMRPYGMFDVSVPMAPMMIGLGLLLTGALLLAADRPAGARLLWPLAATGSLALTCYAGHFALLMLLGAEPPSSFLVFAVVGLTLVVFSTVWRSRARRGPLEWLTNRAVLWAVPAKSPSSPALKGE
ncbi:DUF418 domain-containing protein [Sphaerisporangium sp. B11E5]|uniref:DUF418 domain-containing protein n=1 Tax=Sphaerisporangium sp. B11E5 TaxID=3153563 RepID=UPI00325EAFEC